MLAIGGPRLEVGPEETKLTESGAAGEQHARRDVPRDAAVIHEVIRRAAEAVESPTPYFRVPKVIER